MSLLAEHRLEDVTVRMIVAEAGVGYASFFRQYESLQDILLEIAEERFAASAPMIAPAVLRGELREAAALVARTAIQDRAVSLALLGGGGDELRRFYVAKGTELLQSLDQKPVGLKVHPTLLTTFVVTNVLTILAWWLKEEPTLHEDQVGDMIHDLVFKPLHSQLSR